MHKELFGPISFLIDEELLIFLSRDFIFDFYSFLL